MTNNRMSLLAAGVAALSLSPAWVPQPAAADPAATGSQAVDHHDHHAPPTGRTPPDSPETPATPAGESGAMPMDHGTMDHGAMPGMDHGAMPGMDHGVTPGGEQAASEDVAPAKTDGPSASGGMDHGSMQGGSPPPDARDPHAYSEGYDFGPIPPPRMMGEQHRFGALLTERLEWVHSDDDDSALYDVTAWYGRDYNRLWLKAEGEVDGGKLEDAHTELLWGRAVAAYWDAQLGVRYDSGEGPNRTWLAFGVQGLAPYWFELDATGYLGEKGRSALRLEAEYELLLTQRLILQPRVEANFYGSRDAERERGAGLSSLAAGVRLRYEIRREFAPYVGVERSAKYGETADFARAAGEDKSETLLVAGVRFWF